MYNLIEYSDNYSDTSGSLWQFKRDEQPINNNGAFINITAENSSSLKCKSNFISNTNADWANRKKEGAKTVVTKKIKKWNKRTKRRIFKYVTWHFRS